MITMRVLLPSVLVLSALGVSTATPVRQSSRQLSASESRAGEWQRAYELLRQGDHRAIGMFKRAFEVEQDKRVRQQAAAMLVVLRDSDERYFKYLAGFARDVVVRDSPFPMKVTQDGDVVAGVFSDEFIGWCADRQLQPQQAARRSIYQDPADLFFLGQTGDPRAFDVMLQALDAKNFFVAVRAATSLAYVGDRRAIDPIMKLSRRVPRVLKIMLAEALLHFDDPRALAVAREIAPAEQLLMIHEMVDRDRQKRRDDRAILSRFD